ncbi:MAG UNVERIFIED_CONTAM: hypothetical protein LVR18_46715 [Planctomycetaceae bacterium]
MDNVGGARRIGTMLVRNARNIVFPNVTAERLVQITGTGTTTTAWSHRHRQHQLHPHPGLSTDVGDIDSGTANPSLPDTLWQRPKCGSRCRYRHRDISSLIPTSTPSPVECVFRRPKGTRRHCHAE